MTKKVILIVILAIAVAGCSAHRVSPAEPIFKGKARAMELPMKTTEAQGDMEEAYDPYSDPRTDHNPSLLRGKEAPLDDRPTATSWAEPLDGQALPPAEVRSQVPSPAPEPPPLETAEQITSGPKGSSDQEGSGWLIRFPYPTTVIGVVNPTNCSAQVFAAGDDRVWPVEGGGGRANIEIAGNTGDELLLTAAVDCHVYDPVEKTVTGVFKGMAMRRICAPFRTQRATSWILSEDQFSTNPPEPPPCQAPEPYFATYPNYQGGGWRSYGEAAYGRRTNIYIGVGERRRWRSW